MDPPVYMRRRLAMLSIPTPHTLELPIGRISSACPKTELLFYCSAQEQVHIGNLQAQKRSPAIMRDCHT